MPKFDSDRDDVGDPDAAVDHDAAADPDAAAGPDTDPDSAAEVSVDFSKEPLSASSSDAGLPKALAAVSISPSVQSNAN
jgi:hypothetical protein